MGLATVVFSIIAALGVYKWGTVSEQINDVNEMYSSMKNTILSNTRAGIFSAYYNAALMDESEGMSEREYRRFLARLDKKTRGIFQSFGSFESIAGEDELIDLNEFQQ